METDRRLYSVSICYSFFFLNFDLFSLFFNLKLISHTLDNIWHYNSQIKFPAALSKQIIILLECANDAVTCITPVIILRELNFL